MIYDTYDANGNMTRDRNKGIRSISYNLLNLPKEVLFEDGHVTRYTYAADGRKLRVEYLLSNIRLDEPIGPVFGGGGASLLSSGRIDDVIEFPADSIQSIPAEQTLMVRDYCGNHIYRNGALERVLNDVGYADSTGYHYQVKDYRGDVRAVVSQNGTLEETNSYYPYGMLHGTSAISSTQPYKYTGKELDRENGLDWYDFHARMLMSDIGRTTTLDPLAEKYYSMSPYLWCGGNPINQIDINGCDWVCTNNDGTAVWNWTNTINNAHDALNAGYDGYLPNGSILNNARIGDEEYGAVYLGYSEDDVCYTVSNHDVTPWQVGIEWLTGKGPRHRDFTNGDYFSELLRQHSHYKESIKLAMQKLTNEEFSGANNYSLGGIEGIGKYISDYSTLMTGGLTGNLAVTYLGSYALNWTSRIEGDYAIINFEINNSSTMESGPRPPIIGYTNLWKSSIGKLINNAFVSGMGSKTTQTFRLVERIKITK